MPPRRSTPRKGRAESAESASSTPAKAAASPSSTTGTPRRTARGRRSTAKAAETSAEKTDAPTPSRGRARGAAKSASPAERVHTLPTRTNPRLSEVKSRQVKLQVIRREDKEIIIGRIKLPTVNGAEHGFLLKRFDTNAIAGSSMFRLASVSYTHLTLPTNREV